MMLDKEDDDPYEIGFPRAHFSFRHVYSVLNAFLEMNLGWTKDVSKTWSVCRTMLVRIIATREENFVYRHSECVVGQTQGDPLSILHGPVPVPIWSRRRGHTQSHINQVSNYIGLYDGPRDLGLDQLKNQ